MKSAVNTQHLYKEPSLYKCLMYSSEFSRKKIKYNFQGLFFFSFDTDIYIEDDRVKKIDVEAGF